MKYPKTLCTAPWTNFQLDVNGAVRPCCKFEQPNKASKYQFPNLKEASIDEIWKSDTFVQLRKDFLAGEKPVECRACWEEESSGAKSYRQSMDFRSKIDEDYDFNDIQPETPFSLDLKLSNVCNLKCRICGPVASSLWLKEYMEDPNLSSKFDDYLYENRHYFLKNKLTQDPANRETFQKWLPHLQLIELTGGEPLLSTENIEVLELCHESGYSKDIRLLLVTNGTIFKPKLTAVMEGFQSVIVNFSIDDIGARFEYQRYPGNWENSNKVIERYLSECSDKFEFHCHSTVSVYNVFYLPELIDWFIDKSRIRPWSLIFNILYYNRNMSIQVLPDSAKAAVRKKLRAYMAQMDSEFEYIRKSLEDVINYMDSGDIKERESLWSSFLLQNKERDQFREQTYYKVFPEFVDQMKHGKDLKPDFSETAKHRVGKLYNKLRGLMPK